MSKEIEMSIDEAIDMTQKAIDHLRNKPIDEIDDQEMRKMRAINMELRIIKDMADIRPII